MANGKVMDRQIVVNQRVKEWAGTTGGYKPSRDKLVIGTRGRGEIIKPCLKGLDTHAEFNVSPVAPGERFISDEEFFGRDGIKKLEPLGISVAQKLDDANQTYRRLW